MCLVWVGHPETIISICMAIFRSAANFRVMELGLRLELGILV